MVYGHKLVLGNKKLEVQLCNQLSTCWFGPGKTVDNKMETEMLRTHRINESYVSPRRERKLC